MKFDRRRFLGAGAAAAGLLMAPSALAKNRPVSQLAPTKDGYSSLTPDEALSYLIRGNIAFLNDHGATPPIGAKRRLELSRGQAPFCAYVTCSDSRVSPELLFGRGLGELYIIRNAGNTVDTAAMGSIEYAVAVLKVPLVVVMGHENCTAVQAAQQKVEVNAQFPGSIDKMIEPIVPAVLDVRDKHGTINADSVVKQNVRRVVSRLRRESDPIIQVPQRQGRLKVVGAYYDLDQGRVDFFDQPS